MADSENSRTLPAITCRNILETTEWLLAAQIADRPRFPRGAGEDALGRWQAWLAAFKALERLSAAEQRLEAELLASSSVNIGRGGAGPLWAARVMAVHDGGVEAFRRAAQATEDAADIEDRLAATLFTADVASIGGVVAKLHCVLQRGQPGPDFAEYPWPELRRMLGDLLMIDSQVRNFRRGGSLLPIDGG